MLSMLHAFAVGVAFSVGVACGAVMCAFASSKARKDFAKEMLDHNNRTEERLKGYIVNTGRIADALEKWSVAKAKSK